MRVYRVEHPDTGVGPYNSKYNVRDALMDKHSDFNMYPTKGMEFPYIRWYCCFDSLDILVIWFEGFGQNLIDAGYIIAEYEVPDLCVRHGRSQSVFIKGRAAFVRQHPNSLYI